MAIRAAPHVHGPGKAFVILCANTYLFIIVHCALLACALGHCVCYVSCAHDVAPGAICLER